MKIKLRDAHKLAKNSGFLNVYATKRRMSESDILDLALKKIADFKEWKRKQKEFRAYEHEIRTGKRLR